MNKLEQAIKDFCKFHAGKSSAEEMAVSMTHFVKSIAHGAQVEILNKAIKDLSGSVEIAHSRQQLAGHECKQHLHTLKAQAKVQETEST